MIEPMYKDIYIDGKDSHLANFKKLTEGPVGYSVARAAKILEVNRQAVDKAVRRGALVATRIYIRTGSGEKLISTEIDRESVHEFVLSRDGRNRIPKGFVAQQQELAL